MNEEHKYPRVARMGLLIICYFFLAGLAPGTIAEPGEATSNLQEGELQIPSSFVVVGNRRPRNGRIIKLGKSIIMGGSVVVDDPSSSSLGVANNSIMFSSSMELEEPEYTVEFNPMNTNLNLESDFTIQSVFLEWKVGRAEWTSIQLEDNPSKDILPHFVARIQPDKAGLLKWRLKVLQHNGQLSFTGVRKVRILPPQKPPPATTTTETTTSASLTSTLTTPTSLETTSTNLPPPTTSTEGSTSASSASTSTSTRSIESTAALEITSSKPSSSPSVSPSSKPSDIPSSKPSFSPSVSPSSKPSATPLTSTIAVETTSTNPPLSQTSTTLLGTTATLPGGPRVGLQESCDVSNFDDNAFNICLDLKGETDGPEPWMEHFAAAREFWESVILNDEGGPWYISPELQAQIPKATEVPENLDDIYIAGIATTIDGPGKVLGAAGPMLVVPQQTNLLNGKPFERTVTGFMRFDVADIENRINDGTFGTIIKHEMAHVLGIGSLWSDNAINSGNEGDDMYNGTSANRVWDEMGCNGGRGVPVETHGGQGTAGGHFDEACLLGEIMSGYLGGASVHPVSNLTIAAFEDLGYQVDYSKADPFSTSDMAHTEFCSQYCPALDPRSRKLRGYGEGSAHSRKELSKEGKGAAVEYGKQLMREIATEPSRFSSRRNRVMEEGSDLIYLGVQKLTVFVFEDGHLHSVSISHSGDETDSFT